MAPEPILNRWLRWLRWLRCSACSALSFGRRTSRPMTSNSPCTSTVLGLGNPGTLWRPLLRLVHYEHGGSPVARACRRAGAAGNWGDESEQSPIESWFPEYHNGQLLWLRQLFLFSFLALWRLVSDCCCGSCCYFCSSYYH